MERYTFKKFERLTHRKVFAALFERGQTYKAFPLMLRVLAVQTLDERTFVQAGFSVSKRRFKRAVHRNRIKRLMRESWRHKKKAVNISAGRLSQESDTPEFQFAIAWVYLGKRLPEYDEIDAKISVLTERFIEDMPTFLNEANGQTGKDEKRAT